MTDPSIDEEGTTPWGDFLAEAETRLTAAGLPTARQEARWIIEEVSGVDADEWTVGMTRPATVRGVAAFDTKMAQRLGGEPIQYVLGRWQFRHLE